MVSFIKWFCFQSSGLCLFLFWGLGGERGACRKVASERQLGGVDGWGGTDVPGTGGYELRGKEREPVSFSGEKLLGKKGYDLPPPNLDLGASRPPKAPPMVQRKLGGPKKPSGRGKKGDYKRKKTKGPLEI